jgi:hypothetical protein
MVNIKQNYRNNPIQLHKPIHIKPAIADRLQSYLCTAIGTVD